MYKYERTIIEEGEPTIVKEVNVPDEVVKQIRADAIDEFVKRLKAECRKHYVDCDPYFGGIVDSILYEEDIDEIAEELKAGVKNENWNRYTKGIWRTF